MGILDFFLEKWGKDKDKDNKEQITVAWTVVAEDVDTDPEEIEEFFGISQGDEYGGDSELRASTFKAERDSREFSVWHYTVVFSTDKSDAENPLDEPFDVEWESEDEQEEFFEDAQEDDRKIRNSLGKKFIAQALRNKSKGIIRVRKNRPTDDPMLAAFVANKVNDDWWGIFPPRSLKTSYPRRKRKIGNIGNARRIYYEDEMVFELDADEFHLLRILDEGYEYKKADGTIVKFRDDNLGESKDTGLLDGNGGKNPIDADPVFLEFYKYPTMDFSVFGEDTLGAILGTVL